jgi:hypothetical protein
MSYLSVGRSHRLVRVLASVFNVAVVAMRVFMGLSVVAVLHFTHHGHHPHIPTALVHP